MLLPAHMPMVLVLNAFLYKNRSQILLCWMGDCHVCREYHSRNGLNTGYGYSFGIKMYRLNWPLAIHQDKQFSKFYMRIRAEQEQNCNLNARDCTQLVRSIKDRGRGKYLERGHSDVFRFSSAIFFFIWCHYCAESSLSTERVLEPPRSNWVHRTAREVYTVDGWMDG